MSQKAVDRSECLERVVIVQCNVELPNGPPTELALGRKLSEVDLCFKIVEAHFVPFALPDWWATPTRPHRSSQSSRGLRRAAGSFFGAGSSLCTGSTIGTVKRLTDEL